MINRRRFVSGIVVTGAAGLASRAGLANPPADARLDSPLIYVSPVTSSGALSNCQAEVWFAALDNTLHVVTPPTTWRASAVRQGLGKAQVWIGDVGQWQRSDGRYQKLPGGMAHARLVTDASTQQRVLEVMSKKYADSGWRRYGRAFQTGLADGSRVMLGYSFP